jgi:hypothetical protein
MPSQRPVVTPPATSVPRGMGQPRRLGSAPAPDHGLDRHLVTVEEMTVRGLAGGNTSRQDCVTHNRAMLEIRFTQAARKHRIGRDSVRHVMSTVIPAGTVTSQGNQAWLTSARMSGAGS